MNEHTQQDLELQRRMAEAAALPPHDPYRIETARLVTEAGDWAEQQWLELMREDEQLRLDLQHVDPPVGLIDRLLAVPDQTAPRDSRLRNSLGWAAAVAAMLALATVM